MDTRQPDRTFDDLFKHLLNDVIWLHVKWRIYRQLYGTSAEHVELLNRTAPTFFSVAQEAILNDVLLAISRLTDPATCAGHENLSIARVFEAYEGNDRPNLVPFLRELESACNRIRSRRNRRLAHRDLHTVGDSEALAALGLSRADIERALKSIRDFLNQLCSAAQGGVVEFDCVLNLVEDGDHLVDILQKHDEQSRQRRAAGVSGGSAQVEWHG